MIKVRRTLLFILSSMLFAGCTSSPLQPRTTPGPEAQPGTSAAQLPAPQAIDRGVLGKGSAEAVAWSPDGTLLAVVGSTGVYLYDTRSWTVTQTISSGIIPNDKYGSREIFALAFVPDGNSLILTAAGWPTTYWHYDLQSGELKPWLANMVVDPQGGVLVSPDGAAFAFMNRICLNPGTDAQTCSVGLEVRSTADGTLLCRIQASPEDFGTGIDSYAFSPDGRSLALGTSDNRIRLWETGTGKLQHEMQHDSRIANLTFSPDGKVLASASLDATVRFWDTHSGKNLFVLRGFTQGTQEVAYLEHGKKVMVGLLNDNSFQEYAVNDRGLPGAPLNINMQTGRELYDLYRYQPDETVTAQASVSPDTRTMAVLLNQTVQIWDLEAGKFMLTLPEYNSQINAFVFNPGGDLLAVADHNVDLWQVPTRKLITTLPVNDNKIQDLAFRPNSHELALIDERGNIQVWDTTSHLKLRGIAGDVDECYFSRLSYSPDGTQLAAVGRCGIRIWETATDELGQKIAIAAKDVGDPLKLVFSSDGTQLIYADDGGLWRWDVKTGKSLYSIPLPEGDYIASAALQAGLMVFGESSDGPFVFFNPVTGQHLYDFSEGRGGTAVALSPDERLLARSDYYNIALLDSASGTQLLTIDFDMPYFLSFSPDAKLLAAVSRSNYVRLWDVSSATARVASEPPATTTPLPVVQPTPTATSKPVTQLDIQPLTTPAASSASLGPQNVSRLVQLGQLSRGNIQTAAWSPDGKTIAVGVSSGVYTFNQGSTQPSQFFPTEHPVWALAFSPDGSLLAGHSDVIHVWDLSSGGSLPTLEDSGCPFGSLAFSSDGKILTALCADFTYRWNISDGRLLSRTHTGNFGLTGGPDNNLSFQYSQYQRDNAVLLNKDTQEIVQTFDVPGMAPLLARFSPDGKTLLVWFYQYDIARSGAYVPGKDFKSLAQLWNITPGQLPSLRATLSTGKWVLLFDQLQGPFEGLAFSPDSRRLATASLDGFVRLWDGNTGKLLATLPYPGSNQLSINGSEIFFSSDGQQLLAVGSSVQVWDVSMRRRPVVTWAIPGFSGFGPLLSFTQDGNYLITTTGGAFEFLKKSGATFSEDSPPIPAPGATYNESASPDGKWLAYSTPHGFILGANNLQHPKWETLENFATQSKDAQALAFSPDSSLLAVTDPDEKVLMWHLGTSHSTPLQLSAEQYISTLLFSPDNKYLLGSTGDLSPDDPSSTYLWDTATGELLRSWKTTGGDFAFSPDGVTLAVGSYYDDAVRLYDLRTWNLLREFQGASGLRALTFNPDGSLLLAQCDGKILIWDSASEKLLREMDGYYFSLPAFSPDGKILAMSLTDGRIQFWGLP